MGHKDLLIQLREAVSLSLHPVNTKRSETSSNNPTYCMQSLDIQHCCLLSMFSQTPPWPRLPSGTKEHPKSQRVFLTENKQTAAQLPNTPRPSTNIYVSPNDVDKVSQHQATKIACAAIGIFKTYVRRVVQRYCHLCSFANAHALRVHNVIIQSSL